MDSFLDGGSLLSREVIRSASLGCSRTFLVSIKDPPGGQEESC